MSGVEVNLILKFKNSSSLFDSMREGGKRFDRNIQNVSNIQEVKFSTGSIKCVAVINIHKVRVNIRQRADIEARRPCMIIDANQGPRGPTGAAAAALRSHFK